MNFDKNLQEKIKFSPFKAQKEIITAFNEKRDIRLAAGTRFGKSVLCAYLALREFMQNGRHIWIVAPSYELTEKVFSYVVKWLVHSYPKMQRCISMRPTPQIIAPYTPEEIC